MRKIKFIMLSVLMLMTTTGLFAESSVTVKNFDPYAQIRFFLGYQNIDVEKSALITASQSKVFDETDMRYRMQTNSRFGANFEVENAKGVVEFGLNATNTATSVTVRIAKVTVDLGSGLKITAGQDYSPNTWTAIGDYADDANLCGFGASYDPRTPMISINFNGAYITLMQESRDTTGFSAAQAPDTTVIMPKTAIGYDFKSGGTVLGLGGAINMIKINDKVTVVNSMDGKKIISYLGYAHANVELGDMIVLRGNFAYGQNTGNYGIQNIEAQNKDSLSASLATNFKTSASAVVSGTSVKNSTTIEGYINPMVKLSPVIMIGAGVGYAQADNDTYAKKDAQIAYFIDAKYDLNKYFSILPEFSYRDFMKDTNGNKQGTEYYAGAQVQFKI